MSQPAHDFPPQLWEKLVPSARTAVVALAEALASGVVGKTSVEFVTLPNGGVSEATLVTSRRITAGILDAAKYSV